MANVLPPVVRFKRMALDLLFPRWCVGCGREGEYICPACRQALTPNNSSLCPGCGRPYDGGTPCRACAELPVAVDGISSPFKFGGTIRQAIHELKYRNLRSIAATLAKMLHDYLSENPLPADVIVPVPLHKKRLRERGYNQSALLARELGRLSELLVVDDCLVRHRYTSSQVRAADVGERRSHVAGAFACVNDAVRGKRALLVDDVCTTGATLNAAAAALKSAGAESVWGLTVAAET